MGNSTVSLVGVIKSFVPRWGLTLCEGGGQATETCTATRPSPLLFFLFARTSPDSDCRTGQYTACLRSHRHQPQPGLQVESNLQQAHLVTFAIPPLPRISLISPLTSLLFYPLSHHIRGSFVFHGHLRLDHIPCLVPVQLSRYDDNDVLAAVVAQVSCGGPNPTKPRSGVLTHPLLSPPLHPTTLPPANSILFHLCIGS